MWLYEYYSEVELRLIVELTTTGNYATRTKSASIGVFQALRVYLPLIFINTQLFPVFGSRFAVLSAYIVRTSKSIFSLGW